MGIGDVIERFAKAGESYSRAHQEGLKRGVDLIINSDDSISFPASPSMKDGPTF